MIAKKKTNERDIDDSVFYLFHTLDKNVVVFDAAMDYPIRHGKINTIVPILGYYKNKLKNNFVLHQFDNDNRVGFKKDVSGLRISELDIDFPSVGFPTFPNRKFIQRTGADVIYYHFRLTPSVHILFDSELNSPIQYGSKSTIGAQYSLMPKSSTIFYFEKNTTTGFKLKMAIKSDQSKKLDEDVKKTSEFVKEIKK